MRLAARGFAPRRFPPGHPARIPWRMSPRLPAMPWIRQSRRGACEVRFPRPLPLCDSLYLIRAIDESMVHGIALHVKNRFPIYNSVEIVRSKNESMRKPMLAKPVINVPRQLSQRSVFEALLHRSPISRADLA